MTTSLKEDNRPSQQWYWDDWFSAFDVRLCCLASRGLWIDMLGIMFKAEIRGTLAVNGKQINGKSLAKIIGSPEDEIKILLNELEDQDVFSRLPDGTIFCRRMFKESKRKEDISRIRAEAGKKGAEKRWDSKSIAKPIATDIAKMATASSFPTASPIPKDTSSSEDVSPEPGKPAPSRPSQSQYKIRLILNEDPKRWEGITDEDKKLWEEAYPACDIDFVLQEMVSYWDANRKKLKKNWKRAIVNRLSFLQDRGGTNIKTGKKKSSDMTPEEYNEYQKKHLGGGRD